MKAHCGTTPRTARRPKWSKRPKRPPFKCPYCRRRFDDLGALTGRTTKALGHGEFFEKAHVFADETKTFRGKDGVYRTPVHVTLTDEVVEGLKMFVDLVSSRLNTETRHLNDPARGAMPEAWSWRQDTTRLSLFRSRFAGRAWLPPSPAHAAPQRFGYSRYF